MLTPYERQQSKTEVSKFILEFRDFLVLNWKFVHRLMEVHNFDWNDDPSFVSDWEQANWEFLFQRLLVGPKLFARYNELTSRIIASNARDSYELIFENSQGTAYCFRSFDTKKLDKALDENEELKTYYEISPPFDYVSGVLKNDENAKKSKVLHFPLSEVSFFLIRLVEPSAVLGLYPEENA